MSRVTVQLSPPVTNVVNHVAETERCSMEKAVALMIEGAAVTKMALAIVKQENQGIREVMRDMLAYLELANASGVDVLELDSFMEAFRERMGRWL